MRDTKCTLYIEIGRLVSSILQTVQRCDNFPRGVESKVEAAIAAPKVLTTRQTEYPESGTRESSEVQRIKEALFALRTREIERQSERFPDWVRDTMYLEEQRWIWVQTFCALKGGE